MIWSHEEILEQATRRIQRRLLCERALGHIRALARLLPGGVVSYFLEFRLAARAPQIDFSACARSSRALAASRSQSEWGLGRVATYLPRAFVTAPIWSRIHEFWDAWTDTSSPRGTDRIALVWFEFDGVERALSAASAPGVYLAADFDTALPTTEHALTGLHGAAVPGRATFRRCFEALLDRGEVHFAGIMSARDPSELKLNGTIARGALDEYLTHVGWPGSRARLHRVLDRYSPYCSAPESARCDLMITESLQPRIGVELVASSGQRADHRQLLARLVEDDLACPRKAEEIRSWTEPERRVQGEDEIYFERTAHIKLVLDPSGAVEAKAYLGFTPGLPPLFGRSGPCSRIGQASDPVMATAHGSRGDLASHRTSRT